MYIDIYNHRFPMINHSWIFYGLYLPILQIPNNYIIRIHLNQLNNLKAYLLIIQQQITYSTFIVMYTFKHYYTYIGKKCKYIIFNMHIILMLKCDYTLFCILKSSKFIYLKTRHICSYGKVNPFRKEIAIKKTITSREYYIYNYSEFMDYGQ